MAIVVRASLSVGDFKKLRRNLVEITELAHLFSENFCVLLCGFIDEGLFGGLKAVVTRHKDASLVCAGLQALQLKDRVEEQLSSRLAHLSTTLRHQLRHRPASICMAERMV